MLCQFHSMDANVEHITDIMALILMEDEDFKDDLTQLKSLSIATQSLIKSLPLLFSLKKWVPSKKPKTVSFA